MAVAGVLRGQLNGNGDRERMESGHTGCRGRVVDVGGWEVEMEMGGGKGWYEVWGRMSELSRRSVDFVDHRAEGRNNAIS